MTTPSGRPAVGASRLGHRYQDVIAWQHALHAAHPASTATGFHVESPEGASYDDVVVMDVDSSTYVQAKHVVEAPGRFSLAWLLEPQGKSGESMAQKALRTFRKLRARGQVELLLLTNRELAGGDPIGALRDPTSFTLRHAAKRVLDGDFTDDEALEALKTLQDHLECEQAEMLELLGAWKLQWAYGLPEAERLAKVEMRAYGLQDSDDALRVGTSFIEGLLTLGRRTLSVADLRDALSALGLQVGRAHRTLSVAVIAAEPNAATAQVAVDLRDAFDGRTEEQARGLSNWAAIDTQLEDAVAQLGNPADGPVLVHAAVRLPVWFRLGTLMRATAGWTVGCELGSVPYFSDDAVQPGDILASSTVTGTGEDLVATLSVTHDIRQVVTERLGELGLLQARRLDLIVPSPGQTALAGPAAARRIAEETKQRLMQALEEGPTRHIHLFLACPKPLPLLLGTQWHRLGPVTVYEDLGAGRGYQAAFTVVS